MYLFEYMSVFMCFIFWIVAKNYYIATVKMWDDLLYKFDNTKKEYFYVSKK
jgi:hypothetical protein